MLSPRVISESFNFTRKPVDPTVVVEGINSTRVQLVWDFTAASGSSFLISIKRRSIADPGSQSIQIAARSDSSSAFNGVPPDYEANLPATLVIKNVSRNDEFTYSVGVLNINTGLEELFDEVTVDVLCKYKHFFAYSFVP